MRIWGLLVVVLGSSCSTFPKLDVKTLPTAADHPGAKYVVLLDETHARYAPDGPLGAPQLVTTTRWRVKLLKPTVLPPLRAWYSKTFSVVESMRGRVVMPDGTEVPLDDSKKSDRSVFDGNVLFTDARVLETPVPPLPVGAVFESEIVTRRLDVKPHVLRESFGGELPVNAARVIVTTPRDWLIRWQVQSRDGVAFAPKQEVIGELKQWTFERLNLPGVETDPSGPPDWALVPMVSIRLEAWTEQGQKKQAFPTPEALSTWLAAEYAQQAVATPRDP